METVLKAIADWIKGILTAGIMSNLSGLFDDVNTQVGNIAQQVGTKPSSFEPRVFAMIEALSRNVVLPIAGIILTFIACYGKRRPCRTPCRGAEYPTADCCTAALRRG